MPIFEDKSFKDYVNGLPAATENDLAAGNNMPLVRSSDVKKFPAEDVGVRTELYKNVYQSWGERSFGAGNNTTKLNKVIPAGKRIMVDCSCSVASLTGVNLYAADMTLIKSITIGNNVSSFRCFFAVTADVYYISYYTGVAKTATIAYYSYLGDDFQDATEKIDEEIDGVKSQLIKRTETLIGGKEGSWAKGNTTIVSGISIPAGGKVKCYLSLDDTIVTVGVNFYHVDGTFETETLHNINTATFEREFTAEINKVTLYVSTATNGSIEIFRVVTETLQQQIDALGRRIAEASEEYFQVICNGSKTNTENDFTGVMGSYTTPQDKLWHDWCHFVMPKAETPRKLVILCHGSGNRVGENYDQWYNYQSIGKVFVSLGYAVLVCNFMPVEAEAGLGANLTQPCGNWMIPQIAQNAYNYVVNKYNVERTGCFVYGQSNGGLTAENIVELTEIPVLATVLEVPAISLANHLAVLHPTQVENLFGFRGKAHYDIEKCMGCDAFNRNMSEPIVIPGNYRDNINEFDPLTVTAKKFRKNTPLLLSLSKYDTTLAWTPMLAYAQAIRNAGGNIKTIVYDDPSITHLVLAETSVVGTIGGVNVRGALYNNLAFLRDHGGYSIESIMPAE